MRIYFRVGRIFIRYGEVYEFPTTIYDYLLQYGFIPFLYLCYASPSLILLHRDDHKFGGIADED